MLNKKELEVMPHMDYRYFFMDKYNYYDELSVMSLILSNAVYDRNTTNLSNIETINEKIGLNLNLREVEEDNIKPRKYTYKTKYAIGNKKIEYSKDNTATNLIKKRVIPIIIPEMTSESDGRSYSEIGEKNWLENNKDYGEEIHNVMSYEIYAEMILHDIDEYERNSGDNIPTDKSTAEKKVYWVMGYKEGGAIANILASKLIDQAKDVYAYTFASPMTLYNSSEHSGYSRNGYLARYESIFNVVNESDAYSFIMPQSLGFSRYGMTCIGNIDIYNPVLNKFETNNEGVSKIIKELENIYKGNENKTRTKTYSKDTNKKKNQNYIGLYNVYQRLINAINIDRNNLEYTAIGNKDKENKVDTIREFYNRYRNVTTLSSFVNAIETNYEKIKRAGNEDNYYYIAKNMNNADIVNVVNLNDKRKKRSRRATESDAEEILSALEIMGKEYCNTIATYQAQFRNNSYTTSVNGEYIKEYNINTKVAVRGVGEDLKNEIYNVNIAAYTASRSEANLLKNKTVNLTHADEKRILNFIEQDKKGKMERNGGILLYPNKYINGANKYEKAGDDCVRFAFSTYQSINS